MEHLSNTAAVRLVSLACGFLLSLSLPGALATAAGAPSPPRFAPDETQDSWHGYQRHRFTVDGCPAWVVMPKQAAPGNPWTWCMEFPDAFTENTGVLKLLEKGYHHVHIQVGNTFGSPAALRHFDAFYKILRERSLGPKAVLIGISRGGLYAYNWAARNPDKVACIYGDAPVCDFKSWPGGKGKGKGSPSDWASLIKHYGFASESEALAWKLNPIDNLEPIARARIPLIHVVGDADDVVPVSENTAVLEERYRKLGGRIRVIHKPGVGHHPHGLQDPSPVVQFILNLNSPGASPSTLAPLGDPAAVPAPPSHAIGFPSRDPNLDALPGFKSPPPGYGDVAFYWWVGDSLTRERLQWQIDELAGKGVMGLQINYAHTDRGGRMYGYTMPSDPPLFSEPWWDLLQWFVQAAKAKGMAVSLSDYTLGFGQGWYVDEVLRENPDLNGSTLHHAAKTVEGGRDFEWEIPTNALAVTAYRLEGAGIVPGSGTDLRSAVIGGKLQWKAPPGQWQVFAVSSRTASWSLDPMNPKSGPQIIEKFFQRFEDRNPGESGKGMNFFFSDELGFGVGGNIWTPGFAEEFRRRKGYDLLPELPALFADIGPRTPKIRLDYRDVMVALQEESFFKPVFDWHQQRGMIYGCDHGGRGRDVAEFGDYFRTQRWNQGPGSDQPNLSKDVIKAKVASSIAHLYQRPRVWIEGYYGSGWGTTSAQISDATFANFAMGYNLLTLHGLYYTTHGGWWEWAPPCNHYHMPYWAHMGEFMRCVERLSYLLSQGDHRCDVAILYPVAPAEAGMDGQASVDAAFNLGSHLYGRGIDFDFMDFESLARAQVRGRELHVSGEIYRALVLPSMKAVRWSTLEKAAEFARAGGLVINLGALPQASDRAGRNDAELDALVQQTFTGKSVAQTSRQAADLIAGAFPRDFACDTPLPKGASPYLMHRRIGARDLYMVYGVPKGSECSFRASGHVELWDPWTGQTRPLPVLAQTDAGTRLKLPLDAHEAQLIVFSPGKPAPADPSLPPDSTVKIEGDWEFELQPSLDNRWGDYHWPPTPTRIGAEARQVRYAPETAPNPGWQDPAFDDAAWSRVTTSFGPRFWKLGPLPENFDDTLLAGLKQVDPSRPVEFGGKQYRWQPYDFSWRWGIEGDPGHQGWHGLKENVPDEFIALGRLRFTATDSTYEKEQGGSRYYLWTSVPSSTDQSAHLRVGGNRPAAIWLNQASVKATSGTVAVNAGANPLLLRYDKVGRGFVVLDTSSSPAQVEEANSGAFSANALWIWHPTQPTSSEQWFRKSFQLDKIPSQARLHITCDNGYVAYINGHQVGRGDRWELVQNIDLVPHLRPGTNAIVVHALNTGGEAALIAEVILDSRRIGTDASWLCANNEKGQGIPSKQISSFEESLWFNHPQGPPKLQPAGVEEHPVFKLSPLAMTWHEKPGILPFDIQPQNAHPAGWYRFTAPPGLRALTVKARGKVRAWSNGQELIPGANNTFIVFQPSASLAKVAIRIEHQRGDYGGAALPEPILLDCGAGLIPLVDWSRIDGLASYSGGAWYRKTVRIPQAKQVVLDLGNLVSTAELRINGKPMGIKVAPPWTFDISSAVTPGDNRIEVLVYNTLANHYSTIPTRYRGQPTSGLIGPVTLQVR